MDRVLFLKESTFNTENKELYYGFGMPVAPRLAEEIGTILGISAFGSECIVPKVFFYTINKDSIIASTNDSNCPCIQTDDNIRKSYLVINHNYDNFKSKSYYISLNNLHENFNNMSLDNSSHIASLRKEYLNFGKYIEILPIYVNLNNLKTEEQENVIKMYASLIREQQLSEIDEDSYYLLITPDDRIAPLSELFNQIVGRPNKEDLKPFGYNTSYRNQYKKIFFIGISLSVLTIIVIWYKYFRI